MLHPFGGGNPDVAAALTGRLWSEVVAHCQSVLDPYLSPAERERTRAREARRRWLADPENRAKDAAWSARYRAECQGALLAKKRRYYEENIEAIRAYKAEWYRRNAKRERAKRRARYAAAKRRAAELPP